MNTSSSLDAHRLARRLTAAGHALHHRLWQQLRESGLDPRTLAILGVIDGRLDAPWVRDRIARGGKRVSALAEQGWIERVDDAWSLTDAGHEILDRVDAERAALLADLPADKLAQLVSALDTVAASLGVADDDADPRRRGRFARGFGRAAGPGEHRFDRGPRDGFGPHEGFGPHGRRAHGCGDHRAHGHAAGGRGREHAYERGFDAGFRRGREAGTAL